MNGAPDPCPLQDFAIETDALISYDSVDYQASDRGRKHYERLAQSAVNKRYRNHIVESTISPDMALQMAGIHDS